MRVLKTNCSSLSDVIQISPQKLNEEHLSKGQFLIENFTKCAAQTKRRGQVQDVSLTRGLKKNIVAACQDKIVQLKLETLENRSYSEV